MPEPVNNAPLNNTHGVSKIGNRIKKIHIKTNANGTKILTRIGRANSGCL